MQDEKGSTKISKILITGCDSSFDLCRRFIDDEIRKATTMESVSDIHMGDYIKPAKLDIEKMNRAFGLTYKSKGQIKEPDPLTSNLRELHRKKSKKQNFRKL